jgi:1-deoxy-D-xylulose-5-phosphate synthase
MAYLDKIQNPEDLKKLSITQLKEVASEIRTVMLDKISKVGGHVGPNFGIVETAIALHYVFESPKDKIV